MCANTRWDPVGTRLEGRLEGRLKVSRKVRRKFRRVRNQQHSGRAAGAFSRVVPPSAISMISMSSRRCMAAASENVLRPLASGWRAMIEKCDTSAPCSAEFLKLAAHFFQQLQKYFVSLAFMMPTAGFDLLPVSVTKTPSPAIGTEVPRPAGHSCFSSAQGVLHPGR